MTIKPPRQKLLYLETRFFFLEKSGFTLVEAMLSLVILGLMAVAFSVLYVTGLQALAVQDDSVFIDSLLRSQMEMLISRPFDEVLTEGENAWTETMGDKTYACIWKAEPMDLDEDGTPESKAMTITVSVAGRSLTTLVVDHEGDVGKI